MSSDRVSFPSRPRTLSWLIWCRKEYRWRLSGRVRRPLSCSYLSAHYIKSFSASPPLMDTQVFLLAVLALVYRTWRDNSFIPDTLFPHKLLDCSVLPRSASANVTTRGFLPLFSFVLHSASCVCSLSLRFKLKKDFVFIRAVFLAHDFMWRQVWNEVFLLLRPWSLYATLDCINYLKGFI